jgi:hypothetical protein
MQEHFLSMDKQTNDELLDALRAARQLFQDDPDRNGGRSGVILALQIVLEFFIQRIPPTRNEELNRPLYALLQALDALDDGNVQKLLQKKKKSGRTKVSGLYESQKGYAVFVARRLIASEMNSDDAHKKVANILVKNGCKPARGQYITPSTIERWCENVSDDIDFKGTAAQECKQLEEEYPSAKYDARKEPSVLRRDYYNLLENFIIQSRSNEAK